MSVLTLLKFNKVNSPWQRTVYYKSETGLPFGSRPEFVFTTSFNNNSFKSKVQGTMPYYSQVVAGCECNQALQIPRFNVEFIRPDVVGVYTQPEDLFDTMIAFLTAHKSEIISSLQQLDSA